MASGPPASGEDALIARYFRPLATDPGAFRLDDVNDLAAIDRVIAQAKAEKDRPTLVVTRTHIGYGSPNRQDTAKAHGEALGKEEVLLTKKNLGWPWPEETFKVPPNGRSPPCSASPFMIDAMPCSRIPKCT